MKYTRFQDIPEFTRGGSYNVTVDWKFLESHLENWDCPNMGSPLILNPDFQRHHIWTVDKQIKFVEFCLRGGQSSRQLYFNCSSWQGNYDTPIELVDGKQRLEAVRAFLRGDIPAFDSYFNEYTDSLRMSHGTYFNFQVNNLKTRKEVLQWYVDLNAGGVAHTEEEIEKVRELIRLEK